MRGRFITLEGGEGAGKTTAVQTVADWLEGQGRDFVVTREPGGTPPAERIRELLLDKRTGELSPLSELLLMFAARNENLERVIRPALDAGRDVVCDRFTDASLAYQGGGRQLGREPVELLAGLVHGDLQPDLTLLLDVPVETGLARIDGRGQGPDRFESTRAGFLERVREAYLQQARREPGRIAVIDATGDIGEVDRLVREVLEARLR
ncbi:MAG: dTMP kinase [Wenzhouxiangella sp.]